MRILISTDLPPLLKTFSVEGYYRWRSPIGCGRLSLATPEDGKLKPRVRVTQNIRKDVAR